MAPTDWIVCIADTFGVSIVDLLSNSRRQHIVYARQAAYLVLRQQSYLSLSAIGELFGRDHTTILHGVNAAIDRMAHDARYTALIQDARNTSTLHSAHQDVTADLTTQKF